MGGFSTMRVLGHVLAFGLLSVLSAAQTAAPTVTVEQGELVGATETFEESEFIGVSKTIDVFKGIPFAEPPVGSLRFKAPVAKQPWDGTYNATYFRDACEQDPYLTFGAPVSEDCLHLNIYAPSPKPLGAAVMVWIHGGGFTVGSAVVPDFNGVALVATGDVIVVTINYRLGIFGFLTTGDAASPGNMGLLDQVLALEWIRNNIAAFGGSSDRVTIFGESAGAASVGWLLLTQKTKGLFSQAIMQSGTAVASWASYEDQDVLRKQAFEVGERLGCMTEDSNSLVNCLRYRDASDIMAVYLADPTLFRSVPVIDGDFIVDTPVNLYLTGRYNRAKLLLGTNADEGTVLVVQNPLAADFFISPVPPPISRQLFEELVHEDLLYDFGGANDSHAALEDAIKMRYINWSQADNSDADYFRTYVDLFTDFGFACGANMVARVHAQWGDDVFLYEMTHVPSVTYNQLFGVGPGWLGAGHAEDIPFVFGIPFMPDARSRFTGELQNEEKALSVKFMQFWTNFAKSGNPGLRSAGSQPESIQDFWPKFTIPDLEYKILNLNLTRGRALKSDQCQFWNSYVVQLRTMLGALDAVEREWRQSYATWKYTDLAGWRNGFAHYKAIAMN